MAPIKTVKALPFRYSMWGMNDSLLSKTYPQEF